MAHIAAGFALAVVAGRALRHSNGDNLHTSDKPDDIVETAKVPIPQGISAYFPVDMGNKYKKLGIIGGVGKVVHGKYAGEAVAVMRYKSGKTDETYICPLRRISVLDAATEALLDIYSCGRGLLS